MVNKSQTAGMESSSKDTMPESGNNTGAEELPVADVKVWVLKNFFFNLIILGPFPGYSLYQHHFSCLPKFLH